MGGFGGSNKNIGIGCADARVGKKWIHAHEGEGEWSIAEEELMERITDLAAEQPLHTVVPYRNIKKRDYPKNLPVQDRRPKTAVVSEPGKEDR